MQEMRGSLIGSTMHPGERVAGMVLQIFEERGVCNVGRWVEGEDGKGVR